MALPHVQYIMAGIKAIDNKVATWLCPILDTPDFAGTYSGFPPGTFLPGTIVINDTIVQSLPYPGNVNTPTGNAGGDLGGTYPNPQVVGIEGVPINTSTVAENNWVLTIDTVDGYVHWQPLPTFVDEAGGDLSGNYPNPTVVGLQGRSIATTAPSTGQSLSWNGTKWAPATPAPGFVAGGDLSGSSAAQYVRSLSGANGGGGAVTLATSAWIASANNQPIIKVAGSTILGTDNSNDVTLTAANNITLNAGGVTTVSDLAGNGTGLVGVNNAGILSFVNSSTSSSIQVNNVLSFGGIGDGYMVMDGYMNHSSNPTHLVCATSDPFKVGDVGKLIVVQGAGAAGVPLYTTIASFTSSSTVVLNASASTTVSGATVDFGTDNTTAINAVIAASYESTSATRSPIAYFPPGTYMTTGNHLFSFGQGTGVYLRGAGNPTYENYNMRSIIKAGAACTYLFNGAGIQSHISDIWLHGNGLASDVLLLTYLTSDCLVERTWITTPTSGLFGVGGNAIHIPNGAPSSEEVNHVKFSFCYISGDPTLVKSCGAGVFMFENSEATQQIFEDCIFDQADYLVANEGCDANFLRCQFFRANTCALYVFSIFNNTIESCYTEQLGGGPFFIMGFNAAVTSANTINLINNTINDTNAHIIHNGSQPLLMQGNVINSLVIINKAITGVYAIYPITSIANTFPSAIANGYTFYGDLSLVDQVNTMSPLTSTSITRTNLINKMSFGDNNTISLNGSISGDASSNLTITSAGTGSLYLTTANSAGAIQLQSNGTNIVTITNAALELDTGIYISTSKNQPIIVADGHTILATDTSDNVFFQSNQAATISGTTVSIANPTQTTMIVGPNYVEIEGSTLSASAASGAFRLSAGTLASRSVLYLVNDQGSQWWIASPGPVEYVFAGSPHTVDAGFHNVLVNTFSGITEIIMPAAPYDGQHVTISDPVGQWGSSNDGYLSPNTGQTLQSPATLTTYITSSSHILLNAPGGSLTYQYSSINSNWKLISVVGTFV